MSWDVTLTDDRGHVEIDINYTHNCNRMIRAAATATGVDSIAWWDGFNGLPGPTGAAYLHAVIGELTAHPDVYDEMNPPNGCGDRKSLVETLTKMRDAVPEWPTEWTISG